MYGEMEVGSSYIELGFKYSLDQRPFNCATQPLCSGKPAFVLSAGDRSEMVNKEESSYCPALRAV